MVGSGVFTILELSIIPAVYEDIKDNIFLALGGNTNLWSNFYYMTLTKSVIKLDLIFNLQFWTAFLFVVSDFKNEKKDYYIYIYYSVYGLSLLLSIGSDYLGLKSIRSSAKMNFTLFFFLRAISELIKIFIVFQLWRGQTILFEKIDNLDNDLMESKEGKSLRDYITINGCFTVIMFVWCVNRMYKCYKARKQTMVDTLH